MQITSKTIAQAMFGMAGIIAAYDWYSPGIDLRWEMGIAVGVAGYFGAKLLDKL